MHYDLSVTHIIKQSLNSNFNKKLVQYKCKTVHYSYIIYIYIVWYIYDILRYFVTCHITGMLLFVPVLGVRHSADDGWKTQIFPFS